MTHLVGDSLLMTMLMAGNTRLASFCIVFTVFCLILTGAFTHTQRNLFPALQMRELLTSSQTTTIVDLVNFCKALHITDDIGALKLLECVPPYRKIVFNSRLKSSK